MVKASKKTVVWDLGLRLFHWLLVLAIAMQFLTMKLGDGSYTEWHFRIGFCVLGLIIYRVLWGFIGSESAQFKHFLYSPKAILAYAKSLPSTSYHQYLGHNPVGGLSVILLLAVCGLMAVTGLFISDDILWEAPFYNSVSGDISDTMLRLHHLGEKLLIAVIVVHILAVLLYRFRKKVNLTASMLTGKMTMQSDAISPPRVKSNWSSVLLLILCVAGVFAYLVQRI